jgi:UTP--glucose-1-phosphate uridylyltransferase
MGFQIKKAVFPVAGLGTRFLPATKASPKEMLPIVDKPLIQYAVEEAIASGITELIFITNGSKRSIEDHFDSNHDLEAVLTQIGKKDILKIVQNVLPEGVSCVYVRQPKMLGLGHAVLCAKNIVGQEPFAVILADDLVDSQIPCLQQLIDVFDKENGSVIAVQPVCTEDVKKYGIVDPLKPMETTYVQIKGVVEKPSPDCAPSRLGVIGRYILIPQIFELLEHTNPGSGGEIQLTDAIANLLQTEPVFATTFTGNRYDCGNKLGYLHATIQYALKHPDISEDFVTLLRNLKV